MGLTRYNERGPGEKGGILALVCGAVKRGGESARKQLVSLVQHVLPANHHSM